MNEEKIGIRYENRFVMVNYEAVMNGELKAHKDRLLIYRITEKKPGTFGAWL